MGSKQDISSKAQVRIRSSAGLNNGSIRDVWSCAETTHDCDIEGGTCCGKRDRHSVGGVIGEANSDTLQISRE